MARLGGDDLVEHRQRLVMAPLLAQHGADCARDEDVAGRERERPRQQPVRAGIVAFLLAAPRREVEHHRVGAAAGHRRFGKRRRLRDVVGGKRALDPPAERGIGRPWMWSVGHRPRFARTGGRLSTRRLAAIAAAVSDIDVEGLVARAKQAQRAGRQDEAAALFQRVLAHGEHPLALNALGIRALRRDSLDEATALFHRAIAADPGSPDLWMNLARARRSAGDDAGEEAALEGALAIDQRHFMALVRHAELLERQGRSERAVDRWSGVLAMSGMIEERTPALDAMLEHARDFVARAQAGFAGRVDAALAPHRAGLDPATLRRFDACVDHALGRRRIYANECAGLHVPFLPADEFFERRHFPWMEQLEAQTAAIRAELEAVPAEGGGFTPYVAMQPGTPTNKWSPLDHKLDWGALHLWRHGRRDDAVCARFPATAAAVEALPLARMPGRTPTVFFSILQPGVRLPPHAGVSNARTIIHLGLIVPPGCGFRVGGTTREWREGQAWAFDDTIEHEAWNLSDRPRAILILDVWNPYMTAEEQTLLQAFCTAVDAEGDKDADAFKVSDD